MTELMALKTYFATTVEAALGLARRELGSDALLVSSRSAPDEFQHLGRYEVVFGLDNQTVPNRLTGNFDSGGSEPPKLRQLLELRGVEPGLARQLISGSPSLNSTNTERKPLWRFLKDRMEKRIQVDSRLGNTVALVGPPGRGKTTTLLKLAVLKGLTQRMPLRILALDSRRAGASARLQSLATAMGIPFQLCATVGELDRNLRATENNGLTLIDTPGYGPRDFAEGAELAAYLTNRTQIHVHLVLRADATNADTVRTVQKYSAFGVTRLVLTGMDETELPGPVFTSIVQSEHAVSFLCSGQRIPEDLENASKGRIIDPIFKGWEEVISTAA
jgi:flagellar biosynthesis protein FlhF